MIAGFAEQELLRVPMETARSMRLPCGSRCLARLYQGFEPPQVLAQHELRMLAEHCRDTGSDAAAWRAVLHLRGYEGSPVLRISSELYEPGILEGRIGKRAPRDALVLSVLHHLRRPTHLSIHWPQCHPLRTPLIQHPHRLQVTHKARQVFEVAPHFIRFLRGRVDQERGLR